MGALVGLGVGLGLFLLVAPRSAIATKRSQDRTSRNLELLITADLPALDPRRVDLAGWLLGLLSGLLVLLMTSTWPIAVALGLAASRLPWALLRSRARRRADENRMAWPEAVDHLASAVRAGLPLPEGLCALSTRGPAALREHFAEFAVTYRATGSFPESLDRLEWALADPVADRVIEALRLAREVGGSDLGRLLRTVSVFLREDGRVRAELQTRQGSVVNAAKLAVAAPWAVLLLLGTQSSTVRAYNSFTGVMVLAFGAGLCAVAYRLMIVIGRLPQEQRVLR